MRKIKQMYICPAVNCVNMDVLEMLCGSTEINNISRDSDSGYGPSIEHDGGGEDNDI